MQKSILVTSPDHAFGELLRSSLEESGRYCVHQTANADEAFAAAGMERFDLAILDADGEDEPVAFAGNRLMALNPDMLLMVIPPENDPQHLSLVNFTPHSYLERPFYMPDLLSRLDALLGLVDGEAPPAEKAETKTATVDGFTDWLREGEQIAQDLETLLRETCFKSMLVVNAGRAVGFSDKLDPRDAHRLADLIGRHWDQQSDLMRYIRLEEGGGEYLLFIARLSSEVALGTISDISIPILQVRSRTRALAKDLFQTITQRETEADEQRLLDEVVLNRVQEIVTPEYDQGFDGLMPDDKTTAPEADAGFDQELDDALLVNLTDLLANMPSPDPHPIILQSEWEAAAPDGDNEVSTGSNGSINSVQTMREQPPQEKGQDLILPWEEQGGDSWVFTTPLSPDPASDTHPIHGIEEGFNGSEPTTPVFVQISFTCILIPANIHHRLVGNLAKSLNQLLPKNCLGFGWQLQGLRIQPEYMLWIVSVTPTVSPGNVVRMVRNRTSEQIFAEFPDLREKSMAGDFWAPGYLVVSGSQPPNDQLVSDFIRQTRRRQGIF